MQNYVKTIQREQRAGGGRERERGRNSRGSRRRRDRERETKNSSAIDRDRDRDSGDRVRANNVKSHNTSKLSNEERGRGMAGERWQLRSAVAPLNHSKIGRAGQDGG